AREEPIPVFIEADKLEGHSEKEAQAEGNVQLRRLGQAVFADRLRYDASLQEREASSNVQMQYQNDVLEGEHLRFNLGTERGYFDKPKFRFTPVPRPPAPLAYAPGYTTAYPVAPLANPLISNPRLPAAEARGSAE